SRWEVSRIPSFARRLEGIESTVWPVPETVNINMSDCIASVWHRDMTPNPDLVPASRRAAHQPRIAHIKVRWLRQHQRAAAAAFR
ncbi:MAG: hypothetical protein ACKOI2_10900, partial [Actinomycetota bacterium]